MSNSGILLIDKPTDMTSHDLVNCARKVFHTKKIGHNGTLDPDATGVMVLSINQATRLNEYLVADEKYYRATILFGNETDTQDISGEVVKSAALPDINQEMFCDILKSFIGVQEQKPPMFSAIKKNGKPLYKYAREGIEIEDIPMRTIEVYSIKCISFSPQEAVIDVHCSKGTYIRTLCQDIARRCQSCGCMSKLRRLRVGNFFVDDCCTLDALRSAENPYELLIPSSKVLDFPVVHIESKEMLADLMNGKQICIESHVESVKQDCMYQAIYLDDLVAVGRVENTMFVPKKVFHL